MLAMLANLFSWAWNSLPTSLRSYVVETLAWSYMLGGIGQQLKVTTLTKMVKTRQ